MGRIEEEPYNGRIVITTIILLAYFYGKHFLYGSDFIPPAENTSLASVTLGTALSTFAISNYRLPKGQHRVLREESEIELKPEKNEKITGFETVLVGISIKEDTD